jgi:FixJ family two-component response regulator
VIAGALNKQIAAGLGIAEKTVKIHHGQVMRKLGLTTVAELVQTCQRLGIEPDSDPKT